MALNSHSEKGNMSKIGIIGYNYDQSKQALKEIVENDESACRSMSSWGAVMFDKTRYFIIEDSRGLRGFRFDQLVIVDDNRWNVYDKRNDLILDAILSLAGSCVPNEFLVLEYEY